MQELHTEEWMTVDAYARRYRIKRDQVADLIDSGKLPSKTIQQRNSGRYLYNIRLVNAAATCITMPEELNPLDLL